MKPVNAGACCGSRFLTISLLSMILVLFVAPSAWTQADLSGFWVFRVPTGDGNFRETFFELKQSGETVAGRVLAGGRDVAITDGTFRNGTLQFVVVYGTP